MYDTKTVALVILSVILLVAFLTMVKLLRLIRFLREKNALSAEENEKLFEEIRRLHNECKINEQIWQGKNDIIFMVIDRWFRNVAHNLLPGIKFHGRTFEKDTVIMNYSMPGGGQPIPELKKQAQRQFDRLQQQLGLKYNFQLHWQSGIEEAGRNGSSYTRGNGRR